MERNNVIQFPVERIKPVIQPPVALSLDAVKRLLKEIDAIDDEDDFDFEDYDEEEDFYDFTRIIDHIYMGM